MKSKNRWRKSIKVFCLNNKGTTMLETVVSFVVLVIILAVIYQMIAYCTRLRMKATDVDNMTQAVNKAMYKDNIDESVDKVVCILREKVLSKNDVNIELETALVTELAMDSLDRVLFVDELEEEFNIEIQTEEIASVQTIEDVVNNISEKLSEKSGE